MEGLFRKEALRMETIFSSMQTVVPSHLVDSDAHDFKGLAKK
jgi:hypothetical protein